MQKCFNVTATLCCASKRDLVCGASLTSVMPIEKLAELVCAPLVAVT